MFLQIAPQVWNIVRSIRWCILWRTLHGRRCNRNWQTNALLLKACLRGLMHLQHMLQKSTAHLPERPECWHRGLPHSDTAFLPNGILRRCSRQSWQACTRIEIKQPCHRTDRTEHISVWKDRSRKIRLCHIRWRYHYTERWPVWGWNVLHRERCNSRQLRCGQNQKADNGSGQAHFAPVSEA